MTGQEWVSVTDAAALRGVSKQAISKRLKSLGDQVRTRQVGGKLLLNLPEWDRVTGANADPAQVLRNRDVEPSSQVKEPERPAGDSSLVSRAYSAQRARLAGYDAENARLDLEERTGKLLKVADVEDSMVKLATAMLRIIDQMPAETEDPALRVILKRKATELRLTIANEMKLIDGTESAE